MPHMKQVIVMPNKNTSKDISSVPLTPPAKPSDTSGEQKTEWAVKPPVHPRGHKQIPIPDINDKEAVREAARRWLNESPDRSCTA